MKARALLSTFPGHSPLPLGFAQVPEMHQRTLSPLSGAGQACLGCRPSFLRAPLGPRGGPRWPPGTTGFWKGSLVLEQEAKGHQLEAQRCASCGPDGLPAHLSCGYQPGPALLTEGGGAALATFTSPASPRCPGTVAGALRGTASASGPGGCSERASCSLRAGVRFEPQALVTLVFSREGPVETAESNTTCLPVA